MPYNLLFLLGRRRTVDDLTDDDFAPGLQNRKRCQIENGGLTGPPQRGTMFPHRPLKVRYVPRYSGRAEILGHIFICEGML